jgi:hypothetical protein
MASLLSVTQYFIVNSHANSVRCQEMGLVASLTAMDVCALHYCGQSVQIMLSARFPSVYIELRKSYSHNNSDQG